jgi:hypothetical protein
LNSGISIADKCWKALAIARRRVVSATATPGDKISHIVVNSVHAVLMPSRWPTHQCKLGITLCAAPLNDGYDAIRGIGRRRLAATTSSVATG